MTGETDPTRLLAGMAPVLDGPTYVFATVPPEAAVPDGLAPLMSFREREGLTLILAREAAAAAGLEGAFPCRRITLTVHSALEGTGFLAAVATRLSAAGIPTNPVAGFFHDHLFVPVARAEQALGVLRAMQDEALRGP